MQSQCEMCKNNDDLNSSLEVHLMICSHNVRCVDLEIFSRIVTLFVVKIASDAGQALKSGVLVMHGPKDQKLNYHNQGRQFWWLMHSELPTSGMPTSRQFWGRQYKGLPAIWLCMWRHLVAKFLTNASGALWRPNFQQMYVVPPNDQICKL